MHSSVALQNLGISTGALAQLPEKVLQFGTGVLLRGLPDYLIELANRQGIFNGRIVVVKSTSAGDTREFAQQDNLYTVCVRGVRDGQQVEENVLCSAISRVLTATTEWAAVLACARNPDLQIIISNTTEIGIQLLREDIHNNPPESFPGKLLAFLYARYQAFAGDPKRGLIIAPTELLPNNGDQLAGILQELAEYNQLDAAFIHWLKASNPCCNTLVDRIVPGKPKPSLQAELEAQLGYRDELLIMSEVYALWAIEGSEEVKARFPLHRAHPGLIIAPDILPYRELKLRLLNGGHTFSCGLACLSGINTVVQGMNDPVFSRFLETLLLEEIAASIPAPLSLAEAQSFAQQVLDRFRNPYIEHKWLSISLQYSSKMQMRNVLSIQRYVQQFGRVPKHMALGFAAYLLFMRATKVEAGQYYGHSSGEDYLIQDPQAAYFYDLWQKHAASDLVQNVLANKALWGTDLGALPGLGAQIAFFLQSMQDQGVYRTLEQFLETVK